MAGTSEQHTGGPRLLNLACLGVAAGLAVAIAVMLAGVQFDHWDGVIYDYAVMTGEFSGVHEMHRQVGGLAQGAVFDLVEGATAILGPDVWQGYRLASLILFALGLYLVIRALGATDAPQAPAVLAAALIPLAAIATSSMNATVYLFLALGLIGAALFRSRSVVAQGAGLLLVYGGTQVLHAALGLIGLAALVFVVSRWRRQGEARPRATTLLQACGIMAVLLAMFFAARIIAPPTGLYDTYGDLVDLSPAGLVVALSEQFLRLATPLVLVLLSLLPAVLLVRRRPGKILRWTGPTGLAVFGLLVLIGLNAIPFAATGRSAPFLPAIGNRGAGLEDYRYVLFAIGLAQVAFALVVQGLLRARTDPGPAIWLTGLPVLVTAPLFVWAWAQMLALDEAKARIVDGWTEAAATSRWTSAAACKVPDGDLATRVFAKHRYYFRNYDVNYLGFRATGAARHFICWDQCAAADQLALAELLCDAPHAETTYVFSAISCAQIVAELHGHVAEGAPIPDCF